MAGTGNLWYRNTSFFFWLKSFYEQSSTFARMSGNLSSWSKMTIRLKAGKWGFPWLFNTYMEDVVGEVHAILEVSRIDGDQGKYILSYLLFAAQ